MNQRRLLGFAVAALVGVYTAFTVGAWDGSVRGDGAGSDSLFDWLSVRAVASEGNPYDPLSDLAAVSDVDGRFSDHPHPRFPGALLLQWPLAAVDSDLARPLMAAVTVGSVLVLMWAVGRLTGWPDWVVLLIGVVAFVSFPVRGAFAVGSQGPLVAALLAFAWVRLRDGDDWPAGVVLAAATTLKAFPGLLIVMLFWGRPRAAWWAVGSGAAVNLAGLLLPGVSVSRMVEAFRAVSEVNAVNPVNMSVGIPAVGVAVAVVLLALWARRADVDAVMVAGSTLMLLLSPVLWDHYLAVLLVPVAVAVEWSRTAIRSSSQTSSTRLAGTPTNLTGTP